MLFVAFIDGDEKAGTSKLVSEEIFARSLHRPALTWLQGLAPEK
jgi:hypothetical protein